MASELPRLPDNEIIVAALERYAREEAAERNLGPRNRKAEHGRRAARARELADAIKEWHTTGWRIAICTHCGRVFTTQLRPAHCPACREEIEEAA